MQLNPRLNVYDVEYIVEPEKVLISPGATQTIQVAGPIDREFRTLRIDTGVQGDIVSMELKPFRPIETNPGALVLGDLVRLPNGELTSTFPPIVELRGDGVTKNSLVISDVPPGLRVANIHDHRDGRLTVRFRLSQADAELSLKGTVQFSLKSDPRKTGVPVIAVAPRR